MHQAATCSADKNVGRLTASSDVSVERFKFIRNIMSVIIVAAAVLITLYVWGTIERHPRTDDAAARANVAELFLGPRANRQAGRSG